MLCRSFCLYVLCAARNGSLPLHEIGPPPGGLLIWIDADGLVFKRTYNIPRTMRFSGIPITMTQPGSLRRNVDPKSVGI